MPATDQMSFRHRWTLRVGEEHGLTEGARLLGIMAINKFGKSTEGSEFWPSHKSLAELVGVCERTAERRMNELVSAGLIRKRSGGFQRPNHYLATLPQPDSGDGIASAKTDSSVGIERANADNRDANPGSTVGPIPTAASVEHVQEHSQENSSSPTLTRPSALTADSIAVQASSLPCGCVEGVTQCHECAGHPKVISKLPEERQKQIWERQNEAEGLGSAGDSPEVSRAVRYRSRHR